jgi:lipopolysaccharide/colanic/teichoic acid biosynthesis glycosyltransferase
VSHLPAARERVLIVGMSIARAVVAAIERRSRPRFTVVGIVDDAPDGIVPVGAPLLGPLPRLSAIVDDVRPDRVLVGPGRLPLPALIDSCVTRGIAVEDAAEFYERVAGEVALESLTPARIVFAKRFGPSHAQQNAARVLSVLLAACGLVLLAPLVLLVAAAVKLESEGPVLFRQRRIGAGGRPFWLLKFRTMREGASASEWERDNRGRVTRVGRWLRRLRLDELPQFVNVLRGDMNVVGPRPHPVSNFELFSLVARNMNDRTGSPVSYYALRTMVRPGMTGWAQVRFRYANDLDEEIEKLRYDLYYVKHASLWLDLRILLETARVVVRGHRVAGDRPAAAPPAPAPVPARALTLSGTISPGQAA